MRHARSQSDRVVAGLMVAARARLCRNEQCAQAIRAAQDPERRAKRRRPEDAQGALNRGNAAQQAVLPCRQRSAEEAHSKALAALDQARERRRRKEMTLREANALAIPQLMPIANAV